MFRRALWFAAGAAAGVWATTKVQRTLRGLAPDALAVRAVGRAWGAGQRLREFAWDVRAHTAQREVELKDALGLGATPPEELPLALPAQSGTAPPRRRPALPAAQRGRPPRGGVPAVDGPGAHHHTVHDRTTGTTGKEDH